MTLSAFTRSRRRVASLSAALALALAGSAALAQPTPQPSPEVSSQGLGDLDLWSAPGAKTGLSTDLWRGTSSELARAVLAHMDRPMSPAFVALARRVLATGATAPDGGGADTELAAQRIQALLTLGDARAAWAAAERIPHAETSQALTRAVAEAALATGHDAEACAAGDRLQADRDDPWQLKLRLFCHVLAGEIPAASVTLDLWRQHGGKDAAFEKLAGAAVGGSAEGVKASLSDPLNYAFSRRLGLDLAPALAGAHPALVEAVVPTAPRAGVSDAGELAFAEITGLRAAPTNDAERVLGDAIIEAVVGLAEDRPLGPTLDRLVERGQVGDAKQRARAQAAALLLAATGQPLSPTARAQLATFDVPHGKTTPARLAMLARAGAEKRPGETALLALSIAQQQGPALTVADRAAIVSALMAAGLPDEARAIAAEGVHPLLNP